MDSAPDVCASDIGALSQCVQEYRLPSCTGVELFCRRWKPIDSSPRAVVFLAHGYGEHMAYYEPLAQALLKESFYVFAHDHVGHGQSGGARVHVDSVDEYVRDVVTHFEKVGEEVPADIPRFIVGHSMGGTISIKAAMCHPEMFRGVVLIAPAVIVSPELATPMRLFIVKIVSRFVPHFPVAPIEWNIVSRNKEMVERYSHDNLCHQGKVKAKWAVAMYNALQEINNNLTNVEWPFYVLHGSGDLITDVSGSKLLYDVAVSRDKQIKIYEEASHNLLGELEEVRSSVLTEVVSWISQRLSSPQTIEVVEENAQLLSPSSPLSNGVASDDGVESQSPAQKSSLEIGVVEEAREVVETELPKGRSHEEEQRQESLTSEQPQQPEESKEPVPVETPEVVSVAAEERSEVGPEEQSERVTEVQKEETTADSEQTDDQRIADSEPHQN